MAYDPRNIGAMLGYGGDNGGQTAQGLGQTLYSNMFNGSLPTPLTTGNDPNYRPDKYNAPVYSSAGVSRNMSTPWSGMMGAIVPGSQPRENSNPGTMDSMLGETIRAGHAGSIDRGAAAFLGGGYNPWGREINSQGEVVGNPNQSLADLFTTARGLGMDTSKYSNELGGTDIRGNAMGSGAPNAMDLYNDLNNHTKDYLSVGGLSQGWAGGGANNASRTLYREQDGKLLPVSRPVFRTETKDNGFIGREGITGLSMMLPAFGGWAGILGSGAANTLTAGGGLGLTSGLAGSIGTGATNALVNAGIAGLGGGGVKGALGSLVGTGVGALGNSIMGNANGLGSLFNTAGAGSPMNINPMSSFNSVMNTTGLSNSPLGMASSLFGAAGGGGINANSLRSAAGGLAGSYLGSRLNPQLRGLGGQVGRGLANMWSS